MLGQIENVPCINDAWPSAFFRMCVEEEEEKEERLDTKENVAAVATTIKKKTPNPARLTLTTCDSNIIMHVDSPRGQA